MLIDRKPLTPEEKAEAERQKAALRTNKAATQAFVIDLFAQFSEVLVERFSELERVIEDRFDLVEADQLRYEGTWGADGKAFTRGAIVTDKGTIWHCQSRDITTARPGTNADWKMMAKSNSRGAR